MPLTDILADEMPKFDFGEKIRQLDQAFQKYQFNVRPAQQEIFTVLNKQTEINKEAIDGLQTLLGIFEGLYHERQVALSHQKETKEVEKEFFEETASALTIAKNASHPTIMAHILENMSQKEFKTMFNLLDERAKNRLRKFLR